MMAWNLPSRYPSNVFMWQPGLQPAIDPELYWSPIVFERSHGSTPQSRHNRMHVLNGAVVSPTPGRTQGS